MKGLLSSSSTTGVEMDMKEFSHTNDLIENAEEWMTRVKDMLESGEPTTLHALQALLVEAEGIPVQMEEQQLLTVGIKSRQWRIRVDSTLTAGKAKLQSLQDLAAEVRDLSPLCQRTAKEAPLSVVPRPALFYRELLYSQMDMLTKSLCRLFAPPSLLYMMKTCNVLVNM